MSLGEQNLQLQDNPGGDQVQSRSFRGTLLSLLWVRDQSGVAIKEGLDPDYKQNFLLLSSSSGDAYREK